MADARPEPPLDPDRPPPHRTGAGVGLVFVGGVLGTGARYGVGEAIGPWGVWPAATFCVNVVGAFLLGVLIEALSRRGLDIGVRQRLRLFLGTGFLGAFTTYSTLAVDTDLLVRDGYASVAAAYAVGTVVVGFLATCFGIWAAAAQHRGASR
ncbi:MAG TPA: CrcB family protein [Lapillicoccus sp.]|jgi:CrcB protein